MSSKNSAETGELDDDLCLPKNEENEIEQILNDIGGSFGKFQLFNYTLFSLAMIIIGLNSLGYVFAALNLKYRCHIPECESFDHPVYEANWTQNVIPISNAKLSKCHRYQKIQQNTSGELYNIDKFSAKYSEVEYCTKPAPSDSEVIRCDQDGLIYQTDEVSIAREFNLTCEENEWKLAIVGSYGSTASMLFMSISGMISDRFGRKTILILGFGLASISGLIQSFSINYEMFMFMEFLVSISMSGVYTAAFILSMEWPNMRHRVLVSTLVTSNFYIGMALNGVLAAYTRHFRVYLRWMYTLQLIVCVCVFFGPESLRWLLVKGKKKRIQKILTNAAKVNNRQLSPTTFEIINNKCDKSVKLTNVKTNQPVTDQKQSLKALFLSPILAFRFAICSLSWVTATYVYDGVNIISVSLSGDKYVNFSVTVLGGLPSGILLCYLLKYLGRPKSISLSLLVTSITILTAKFLPVSFEVTKLILFFIAECFVSLAFAAVYVHTSEMWPTPLRQLMMGLCSTVGRLGSIMAPLAPLLANIYEPLPYLSFGILSGITGLLVLYLPETLNKPLPDSIEEAIIIGKKVAKGKRDTSEI